MAATESTDRRLAGAALLVATLLGPGSALADDRVSLGGVYFTDTDDLTVVQPAVSANVQVSEDVHVSGGYEADVISAATVDIRTSASVRPFEETRHGGRAGVDVALARLTTLSAGYALSRSPDYLSNALSLRLQHEDESRRHTFSLEVAGAYDSVGRVGDQGPTGDAGTLSAGARWGIVISPSLVVDLGASLEHRRGYLESPYRFVRIRGGGSQVWVPEEIPDERWRAAGQLGLRWAIADPLYVRASYRLHGDSWGIFGHTVDVSGHLAPAPGWLISLSGRTLIQRGASFYSGNYATLPDLPRFRTRDRTLSPHWVLSSRASVRIPLVNVGGFNISALVGGRVTWRRYFDTPLLPERTSFQTSLTLVAER